MPGMTLPLLIAESPSTPMIVRRNRIITVGEFAQAVHHLTATWPSAHHLINLCEQRFHFLLVFAVACLRGQMTLLPPNQTSGVLHDLRDRFADCTIVHDADIERILAAHHLSFSTSVPDWRIDADRIVALAFTSGSTGAPQAHAKTWRTLFVNAQLAAMEILGGAGSQLVATVPPQHVYGLETSAISALVANCAVFDAKPFFPQDVRAALEALSSPRTLVTTPTHLHALLEARVQLPSVARVISATAPLAKEIAERIEANWNTEVFEIYGCTEAGIMARRRTARTTTWLTFSGGHMESRGDVAHYSAPQLPDSIPLQDVLELTTPQEFQLRGRAADMIKVGGKRASLQALTQTLLAIDGVRDGIVFVPTENARPAALVVAPQLNRAQILSALGERIDAVFLPRPLIFVDELPRNSVGKLPHDALVKMLRAPTSAS